MAGSDGRATAAIIINWRSADDTVRLVESLLPCVADGLRFVVLENGSGEGEQIRRAFAAPRFDGCATLLESTSNVGFSAGVNRAVEAALSAEEPPDYLWLLNPDMYPGPGILAELLAVAKESGAEVVSARAGDHERFSGEKWPLAYFGPRFGRRTKPQSGARWWYTERYHGGCALIERSLVAQLRAQGEFLHEPFFLYWDEWDTSLRAARLGARFAVAARAQVHHRSVARGHSIPGLPEARTYYIVRNGVLLGRRSFALWQQPFVIPLHIARDAFYYLGVERCSPRLFLRAVVDGLRGKTGRWDLHPPDS